MKRRGKKGCKKEFEREKSKYIAKYVNKYWWKHDLKGAWESDVLWEINSFFFTIFCRIITKGQKKQKIYSNQIRKWDFGSRGFHTSLCSASCKRKVQTHATEPTS